MKYLKKFHTSAYYIQTSEKSDEEKTLKEARDWGEAYRSKGKNYIGLLFRSLTNKKSGMMY